MIRCNVCKKQIINRRVKLNGKYYHPSCGFIKTMRMKNKSKSNSLVNYIMVSLLILLMPLFATPIAAEIFNGDTVYINSTNAYISATPHTLNNDGYVTLEVLSKQYTGNINVLLGFDSENALPKSLELVNRDIIEVNDVNGSRFEEVISYQNIASQFTKYNHDFDGKNVWYVATNMPIISGNTYELRMYLDIIGGDGKYDIAFYPSSYGFNIGQAINNGHFEYLDPYWSFQTSSNWTEYNQNGNIVCEIDTSGNFTGLHINSDNIVQACYYNVADVTTGIYKLKYEILPVGKDSGTGHTSFGVFNTDIPALDGEGVFQDSAGSNNFRVKSDLDVKAATLFSMTTGGSYSYNITSYYDFDNNLFDFYLNNTKIHSSTTWLVDSIKSIGFVQGGSADSQDYYIRNLFFCQVQNMTDICPEEISTPLPVINLESFIIPNPRTNNDIVYYYSNLTIDGESLPNATCYVEINESEKVQFFDTETPTNNFTLTQTFNRVLYFGETDAGEHDKLDLNITIRKQVTTVNNISFYTCFERYDNVADFTLCERKDLTASQVSTTYDDYVLSFNKTPCDNKCNVSTFISYTGTNPYIMKTDVVNSGHFYRIVSPGNFQLLAFEPYIFFDLGGKNMTMHYNASSGLYYDREDFSFEVPYHQDAGNFTNTFKCIYNNTLYTNTVFEIINPNGSIQRIELISPINPLQNQTITTISNTPVDLVNYTITAPNGSVYKYFNTTTIFFEVLDIPGLWTGTVYVLSNEFNWNDTKSFNYTVNCIENWECTDYSNVCVGGLITRTCTDLNSCGSTLTKPDTQATCIETGQAIKDVGILGLLLLIWIVAIILSVIMKKGSWLMIASVIGFIIFLTETDIRTIIRVLMMGINFALFFMGIDIVRGKGK